MTQPNHIVCPRRRAISPSSLKQGYIVNYFSPKSAFGFFSFLFFFFLFVLNKEEALATITQKRNGDKSRLYVLWQSSGYSLIIKMLDFIEHIHL